MLKLPRLSMINKNKVAHKRLLLTHNHLLSTSPNTSSSTEYSYVTTGSKFSKGFQQYATKNNQIQSYFHDIPLDLDLRKGTANVVIEIPRWSNAKFEINTKLPGNPITQDVKKGQVRFVKNLFPFHGYIHNYGAFPQTWEDITNLNGSLNLYGDNDPLDVVEIGSRVYSTGDIINVKILGSLALIDDGELDWKVFVINTSDPLAQSINDINDVEIACPKLLDSTREWFRNYKVPDGKPQNQFAFDGSFKDKAFTLNLIEENHFAWNNLIHEKVIASDKLPNVVNTTIKSSPKFITEYPEIKIEPKLPSPLPLDVNKSYFI